MIDDLHVHPTSISFFQRFQIPPQFFGQIPRTDVIQDKFPVLLGLGKMSLHEGLINQSPVPFANPFQMVGVRPVGGVIDKIVFDWVGMDIAAEVEKRCFHPTSPQL